MPDTPVIQWTSPDGTRRMAVMRDVSGRYRFEEERYCVEDETEFGGGTYEYWSCCATSGLYPSALDAQNDAALQMPWLRDLLDTLS